LFPLRDENPTVLTPYVTIALIAVNVLAWLYVQGAGLSTVALANSVCRYGAIPAELTGQTGAYGGIDLGPGVPPCAFGELTYAATLTSMFMHGSWVHLLGNMWFLWLFGNNVEDSMGHLRFLVFYLLAGIAAVVAHVWMELDSMVPIVGASGAISGVMGAYLVLYPRVRIQTLFILIIFLRIFAVPAWFILAYWFALQLLSGYATPAGDGGVAFWAHVGGFVAGAALVKLFENRTLVEARRRHIRLSPFEVDHGGWY
jgi:membrane associated rhomboid family serine protease